MTTDSRASCRITSSWFDGRAGKWQHIPASDATFHG
jgi:hypothetical protein